MAVCTENNIFGTFFVLSGALNSVSEKWGLNTNSTGFTDSKKPHPFNHPFFLQCGKFFGQLFCLLLYGIVFGRCGGSNVPLTLPTRHPNGGSQNQRQNNILDIQHPEPTQWSKFIFLFPAMCDLLKTGMLFVGLKLTYSSSYMMLRGSVLFFTALLSVAFLARNFQTQMWIGISVTVSGMAVIGLSDYVFVEHDNYDSYGVAAGDLLIVMAQIMTATQVVLEQKFVTKHNIHPLYAVGLEGVFGFLISVILLIPFYFIPAGAFNRVPPHTLEDSLDAFMQIKGTWQIALAFIGCVVSIAFYYYFGIDFAKKHGAISRMVLDGFASVIAWSVFFGLKWEKFYLLQILGFNLIWIGIFLYSDTLFLPILRKLQRRCCPSTIHEAGLPCGDHAPLLANQEIPDGRIRPVNPPASELAELPQ